MQHLKHAFYIFLLGLPNMAMAQDLSADQIKIMTHIEREAREQGVPRELALAYGEVETMFKDKRSGRSYGPLQVDKSSVPPDQHKLVPLLNWNVKKGIAILKANLIRTKGHAEKARYMYVCGRLYNRSCSKEKIRLIKNRWSSVASKWEVKNVYQQFSF